MKKILLFLFLTFNSLVFFVFSVFGASSDELTAISVYNREYYGTLTENSDGTTTFTTLDEADLVSISGEWNKDTFAGECTITYADGSCQTVTYKKGSINGTVVQVYPNGTSREFLCRNGTPYLYIRSYDSDGELTGTDWYYLSTPIQTFVSEAVTTDYTSLLGEPNAYIGLPLAVSGTVSAIYESDNEKIIKLTDSDGNLYLFNYQDSNTYKYKTADVCTLKEGQKITLYGIFEGLEDELEKNTDSLFHSIPGYDVDFDEISDHIVTDSFVSSSQSVLTIVDPDFSSTLPVFTAIYCDQVLPRPDSEKQDYRDVCDQPLYFYKNDLQLKGTIAYITDSLTFIKEEQTSDIYVTATEAFANSALAVGDSISCSATFSGTAKVPCYDSDTRDFRYVLYPEIIISSISTEN